ncbi:DUF3397 family protein [Allofustis seminis]|uniref:DUF3397 family protein n=1 Tax=Allofustis seminis TaxID=166939 RepID=UPI00037BD713|nr:DUF3397 family protein [Allofustis seminis]
MSGLVDLIVAIIFYLFPFIILFNFKKVDLILTKLVKSLRTPDVLVPYLVVSVIGMDALLFTFPYTLYLVILVCILGIMLASYLYFMTGEIYFWKIFRVWWRLIFIIAIFGHSILGIYFLYCMW